MVNKLLVGLSVVVVISALGIGVLVGTQLAGDSSSSPISGGGTNGEAATATATATAGNETTTEQRTDVPARLFDEAAIATYIAEFINEERAEDGLEPLSTDGNTAEQLRAMAQNHSETMASTGEVAYTINNVSSAERYRNYGLYEQCKINRDNNYVIYPDDAAFEAVGDTIAGQSYNDGGQQRFNEDERAVARAIVDRWSAFNTYEDRLTYKESRRIGVGVVVTQDNKVYVTANVCT